MSFTAGIRDPRMRCVLPPPSLLIGCAGCTCSEGLAAPAAGRHSLGVVALVIGGFGLAVLALVGVRCVKRRR